MTINPREGKPIRRKALDPGRFRPRARARAVWEYARLRQLCRCVYVCVREQSCKKLPFCPVLLNMPRKNVKQGPPNIAFTLRDMEVKPISGYLGKPML